MMMTPGVHKRAGSGARRGQVCAGVGFVLAMGIVCATAVALKDQPFRLRYRVADLLTGKHLAGLKLCELVEKALSHGGELDAHDVTMDGREMAVRTTLRWHKMVISLLAKFRAAYGMIVTVDTNWGSSDAENFLEEIGVEIHSHVTCIGGVHAKVSYPVEWEAAENSMTNHRACGGAGCEACGGEGRVFAVRCADP